MRARLAGEEGIVLAASVSVCVGVSVCLLPVQAKTEKTTDQKLMQLGRNTCCGELQKWLDFGTFLTLTFDLVS